MGDRRNVVALAAVLAALLAVTLLLRPYADTGRDDPRATTFRSGPSGARALLLLMDELGIPAEQALRPWSLLAEPEGAVVVLAPSQDPQPAEVEALLAWVEHGGTLVYGAGRAADPVLRALDVGQLLPLRQRDGAAAHAGRPAEAEHPWLVGVDSVGGFRAGFARRPGSAGDAARATTLLRTAEDRAVLVLIASGSGRVIVFSDARVLSNAQLRDDGAALVFARIAAASVAAGGVVRFDEYHHGFREGGPVRALRGFLTGTRPGRAVLQLMVAGLALLLLFGRRFGAPLQERTGRRRSPLEHVDAVAAAYRRAGARTTARRLILAGLERRLGRRVMYESGVTGGVMESAAGRRLVQEWERGELVGLADAVDEFVAEVRRWK